jgi:hypothetical protein
MSPGHFIIAGAQRSGTTLLHRLLDQHPEIEMSHPVRPEPKYFLRSDAAQQSSDHYRRTLFRGKPGARLLGEKSTSYFERSDLADAMLAVLPGVRFVFVLRDPTERAISHYRFSVDSGADDLAIEEAFAREESRRGTYDRTQFSASPFAYLTGGAYARHIERWEAAVGRERLYLMLFEDLIGDPSAIGRLFQWLGVIPFDCTPPEAPVNSSQTPVHVAPELRRALIEHFRGPNRLLAQRYDLDLSPWQS